MLEEECEAEGHKRLLETPAIDPKITQTAAAAVKQQKKQQNGSAV